MRVPWNAAPAALVLGAVGANLAVPNERVRQRLTPVMYGAGVAVTLGMSKSPVVGPLWNRTVEPLFVDLLDNVVYAVREGFVKGLRSDGGDGGGGEDDESEGGASAQG